MKTAKLSVVKVFCVLSVRKTPPQAETGIGDLMARIAGVDLPRTKTVEYGLTAILVSVYLPLVKFVLNLV